MLEVLVLGVHPFKKNRKKGKKKLQKLHFELYSARIPEANSEQF